MNQRVTRSRTDVGFTLIELLVVVIMLGLVLTVLAAAFSVIVRTTPDNENRIGDANTAQGLTTYLPEDANSTPSSGFSFSKGDVSGCAGATDPGVSLMKLSWTELSQSFVANYRYELDGDGDGFRIVRYSCIDGGSVTRARLSSDLPPIDEAAWTPGSPPVVVTPALDGAGDPIGVTLDVTTTAGEQIRLEGRTNNPDNTLPPAPSGPGGGGGPGPNTAPVASPVSAVIAATGSSDVALDIVDADLDPLTASYSNDVPVPVPTSGSWTIALTGLVATVTPPPGAVDGDMLTFDFVGNDGEVDSNTATASITIGTPNASPVAGDLSVTIDERATTQIAVPISDADGDALTVSIVSADSSLNVSVTSVSATDVVFEVLSDGSVPSPTFTYRVDDGMSTDDGMVSLNITRCVVSGVSPVAQSVARQDGNVARLATAVTFTLASTGPCAGRVSLAYISDLSISPAPLPSNLFFNPSGVATFSVGHGDWIKPNGSPTHPSYTWTLTPYLDGTAIVGVDTVSLTVLVP
ncbi:MAG: hypothetical protein CL424_15890 [Acidimicrobiaceae bacterium]|nr:hypothetical protein [Acidimicrobiaceae bacterium]